MLADRAMLPGRGVRTLDLTSGVGTGPTELAAFDAALLDAGIANFNLIRLSSVIPPGSVIRRPPGGRASPAGEWGNRLYVVLSDSTASAPGQEAWAGIGWVQDPESLRGLFVEHHGQSEAAVRRDIELSLEALCESRGINFPPPAMAVAGTECRDRPAAALMAAVFASEPWR